MPVSVVPAHINICVENLIKTNGILVLTSTSRHLGSKSSYSTYKQVCGKFWQRLLKKLISMQHQQAPTSGLLCKGPVVTRPPCPRFQPFFSGKFFLFFSTSATVIFARLVRWNSPIRREQPTLYLLAHAREQNRFDRRNL